MVTNVGVVEAPGDVVMFPIWRRDVGLDVPMPTELEVYTTPPELVHWAKDETVMVVVKMKVNKGLFI